MSEIKEPTSAIEFIIANARKYADAKAERVFVEQFLKSKKAILMSDSGAKTATEREQYAYSNREYMDLLDGLREAIKVEETLKFHLKAAELRIDVWRTSQASNRNQDRAMR